MKELMMNEDIADVTLITEDKKQIKANINILSTCSPVFKDILKKENNSNQIMYLRGIQYYEMESIMQFIYLGEATFYEERMDEFLAVAKLLEIKELCNTEIESNDEQYRNELSLCDPVLPTETQNFEEQSVISHEMKIQTTVESQRKVSNHGRYECDQCNKIYSTSKSLIHHQQSIHQGVKYTCGQCDKQLTTQSDLTRHVQSMHEGLKYSCDQCEYQATQQGNLTQHIYSKHGGACYPCNHCGFFATTQRNLTRHIQSKHEGPKYACNQCDYRSTRKDSLSKHVQSKHEQ